MTAPRNPDLPSPTFCVIPWVHLFGDELGHMRPCCMAIGERERHNVDASGQPHVVYGDLEAGWNSPFMTGLRRDMLEGRRPSACARCFGDEDLAIRSYREDSNASFAGDIAHAVASTAPDGAAPLPLVRSLDLRLGNLCNLKCRMCSPVSTKLLIPEWKALFELSADDQAQLDELARVDWFSSDAFWDNCERLIPNLDRLHFGGGEPLLITRMLDFLARVVESGRAGKIRLSYVTNLTSLPARVTTLWPAFQDVRLVVSLDGVGPVNEYIRFPSRFAQIDANLQRLIDDPASFNCAKISINTTVQAYNVLRLADICEYLFTKRAPHVVPYPRLSLLYYSSPFSVQVLPRDLKDLAASRLRAFVDRWQGRWPDDSDERDLFLQSIEGVIEHLYAADHSEELPELVRRTSIYDTSRGQNVRDVLPELGSLFPAAAPV